MLLSAECHLTDQTHYHSVLLLFGADINRIDKNKFSALDYACHIGHLEIVNLLLEAGADKEQLTSQIPPLTSKLSSNKYVPLKGSDWDVDWCW